MNCMNYPVYFCVSRLILTPTLSYLSPFFQSSPLIIHSSEIYYSLT